MTTQLLEEKLRTVPEGSDDELGDQPDNISVVSYTSVKRAIPSSNINLESDRKNQDDDSEDEQGDFDYLKDVFKASKVSNLTGTSIKAVAKIIRGGSEDMMTGSRTDKGDKSFQKEILQAMAAELLKSNIEQTRQPKNLLELPTQQAPELK